MALFLSPTFAIGFNKKTMRKSMITLNRKWIRLIGIVGCTMCLASCKQASDASGMKPSYATMKVEATDKELSTSYSATIRGRQDIDIYPQVSGTIEKLCVTEGQKVRRGQTAFHHRPGSLQGCTQNGRCQCGSGTCRTGYCRTDLQQQQGIVCAESGFGIQPEDCRKQPTLPPRRNSRRPRPRR